MPMLRFPWQDLSLHLVWSRLGKKDWLTRLEWFKDIAMEVLLASLAMIGIITVCVILALVYEKKVGGKKVGGKKVGGKKDNSTNIPTVSVSKDDILNNKLDKLNRKLDRIYDVLNHIRWIGLGLAGLFTVTFILPQCARL